jgi:hypothetical protein
MGGDGQIEEYWNQTGASSRLDQGRAGKINARVPYPQCRSFRRCLVDVVDWAAAPMA